MYRVTAAAAHIAAHAAKSSTVCRRSRSRSVSIT
jgi:hypothetical protein